MEVILYHACQSLADPIPWWENAGFESQEDLPFYSKNGSVEKYGQWELSPGLQRKRFQPINYSDYLWELADMISFPEVLNELDKSAGCSRISEWLDRAECIIRNDSNVSYHS